MKTALTILAIAALALGGWWLAQPQQPNSGAEENFVEAENQLVGTWQSAQDAKSIIVFTEGGEQQDIYDGEVLSTGVWELHSQENSDGVFLGTFIEGEAFEYAILEADADTLTLSYQARGNTLNYARVVEEEKPVEPKAVLPGSWQPYTNTEYGFTLLHPTDWEVQEALKPQDLGATHEVVIWESDYEMWRSSVAVRIYPNDNNLSTQKWWSARLIAEDIKETECRAEYADTAPCLFLRGLVNWEKEAKVNGEDAIAVGLFRFDHEEECTYVARGTTVFGICAAADNPNDPRAEEHQATTDAIQSSFTWLSSQPE